MPFDLKIDRTSNLPIYLQIRDELGQRISDGRLTPGLRLPSARELARSIGVNRNTVAQAYEAMSRDGTVRSSVGQGTFVAERTTRPPSESPAKTPGLDWSTRLAQPSSGSTRRVLSTLQSPPGATSSIVFTKAVADPDLFPLEEIQKISREILTRDSSILYDYGPPSGYGPLRELLQSRLAEQQIDSERNEILIINGSTQGLDLIARLLVRKGDCVGIEVPTYSGALNLFSMHDVRYATAPVDDGGMVVEHLERPAQSRELKLIYTMPRFHNPCGTSMSEERRSQLLELGRRNEIPIFEDDPEAELRFDGEVQTPLKALDRYDGVISSGTFSKIAFPGFRIGWLVVPRALFEHVVALKAATDISSNLFSQVLFFEFLKRGALERHLARVLPIYRRRRDVMVDALETHLPEGTTFCRPQGGLVLWVRLPSGITADSLLRRTSQRGVLFTPGRLFVPGEETEGLRLSFASEKRTNIERGVSILAEEIRNELRELSQSPPSGPNLAEGLPLV